MEHLIFLLSHTERYRESSYVLLLLVFLFSLLLLPEKYASSMALILALFTENIFKVSMTVSLKDKLGVNQSHITYKNAL